MTTATTTTPSRGFLVLAASAMTVMSGAALAPGLASLHAALAPDAAGAGLGRFALVLPALVVLCFGPLIGRLAAVHDPRRVLCGGLLAVAVFGAAGIAASGYGWLLLSRTALGFATAAVLCAATAAIARHYEGAERGRMMSSQTAVNTLAGVVFIFCAGLMTAVSWRLPFLLYLLALPIAVLAWWIDWGPAGAPGGGRTSVSWRADLPWLGAICGAMAAFYMMPVQVPFLTEAVAGPGAAGLVISIATLASAPAAIGAPRAAAALGRAGVLLTGTVLIAVGAATMALAVHVLAAALAAALAGCGFGLILPTASLAVMNRAEPGERDIKSGRIASAIYGGQLLAAALASLISPWGAGAPFWLLAILAATAVATGPILVRRRRNPGSAAPASPARSS